MTLLEARPDVWHGIELGGFDVHAARSASPHERAQLIHRKTLVPPAIVFAPGSPPVFSDSGPIPLYGGGLSWPEESAAIDVQTGGSRVPIARLWEALLSGEGVVRGQRLRPEEGLALAARSVLGVKSGERCQVCLVIPDALTESRQQELIEACDRDGVDAVLLWRPVAAALAWLRMFGQELTRTVDKETVLGQFLALHIGIDGFEAAWLEMIVRPPERGWINPARRRSKPSRHVPDVGRGLFTKAAAKAVAGRAREGADAWRALWASPATRDLVAGMPPIAPYPLWGVPPSFAERFAGELSRVLEHVLGPGEATRQQARQLDGRSLPNCSQSAKVDAWIAELRTEGARRLTTGPFLGAFASGELANVAVGETTMAQAMLARIAPSSRGRIVCEGEASSPRGSLAVSAAEFAERRSKGLPTYLDTLPRLETLILKRAKPLWEPLLADADNYVEGGRRWTRDPRVGPFFVRPHSKTLDLSVWLDSEDVVKRVSAHFDTPPSDRVEVTLDVSIEPARGNAQISVVPQIRDALGGRVVRLDWRRAEDTRKSRDELSKEAEVPCPAVQPRGAWAPTWSQHGARILRDLEQIKPDANPALTTYFLCSRRLRDLMRKKPQAAQVQRVEGGIVSFGITDSEGHLARLHKGDQQALDGGLAGMLASLSSRGDELTIAAGDILATLGYACFGGKGVEELAGRILSVGSTSREEAIFLGGTLRDAKLIARFAERVAQQLEYGGQGLGGVAGSNDRLKALWYVLQYREDATEAMSSSLAESVTMTCVRHLERSFAVRQCNYLERHSLVVAAFLMRRRIHDDDFFDPASDLAKHAKRVLVYGIREIAANRMIPMGGSVDAKALMIRVLAFIERRGTLEPLTA